MEIKEILQKGFWTVFARGIGAGIMFVITIFFARWLGVEDYGIFYLGLAHMNILAVFSRWGTDQVLLKQVGIYWKNNLEIAKAYSIVSIKLVLIISLIFALLISGLSEVIAEEIFNKPKFSEVLFWFGPLIIFTSVNFTLAESYKGTGRFILSTYLQNVIASLIVFFLGSIFYLLGKFNLIVAVQILSIGSLIALIVSASLWKKIFNTNLKQSIKIVQIIKQGWPMLLITSGGLILLWSDIFILGIFGSADELGLYSAASRVVGVTSLIIVAINSITAPKYATLYNKSDITELKKLSRNSFKITLFIGLISTITMIIFSGWILKIFGDEFIAGVNILIILSFGQGCNICLGSTSYLLSMTGKEKIMKKIMLSTAIINIIFSILLFQIFGSYGIALSTTISIIIWKFWSLIEVKKHLGFWITSLEKTN